MSTTATAHGIDLASMGPRSIDRGKDLRAGQALGLELLQWGRDQLIAESRMASRSYQVNHLVASMGPRSIDRGKSPVVWRAPVGIAPASMGPRSIDRGKADTVAVTAVVSRALQWGRDQLIAERSRSAIGAALQAWRFNGAAIN